MKTAAAPNASSQFADQLIGPKVAELWQLVEAILGAARTTGESHVGALAQHLDTALQAIRPLIGTSVRPGMHAGIQRTQGDAMLVQHLIKAANLLDATGSEDARQASEGIDAVLASLTAVADHGNLSQHLADTLSCLTKAIDQARQENSPAASHLVQMSETLKHIIDAENDWEEKTQEIPSPYATTELQTQEGIPLGFGPNERTEPGTDPAMWLPSASKTTESAVIFERLTKVADLLDSEGYIGAASLIDTIIKDAMDLPKSPTLMESREELYDAVAHNKQTMLPITEQEVEENRKKHHLHTMRDKAMSLSTRYAPDMPGVQVMHVADGVAQNVLTHEIYDYNHGFTMADGTKMPGGSVKNQTPMFSQIVNPSRLFDTKVDLEKKTRS